MENTKLISRQSSDIKPSFSEYLEDIKHRIIYRLKKRKNIVAIIRAFIAIKYFGPWRGFIIKRILLNNPNPPLKEHPFTIFPSIDPDMFIKGIEKNGYQTGINLSDNYIKNILAYHQQNGKEMRIDPEKCKEVNKIVYDPTVLKIVRSYIGGEPILLATNVYRKQDKVVKPRGFHYNVGDYKMLTIFFYLTDVDEDSCPHAYIPGTHKLHKLRKLLSNSLSFKLAEKKYGDIIKVFTGKKGTGFFEDLIGYHKRTFGKKSRTVLMVTYSLSRKPPKNAKRMEEIMLAKKAS